MTQGLGSSGVLRHTGERHPQRPQPVSSPGPRAVLCPMRVASSLPAGWLRSETPTPGATRTGAPIAAAACLSSPASSADTGRPVNESGQQLRPNWTHASAQAPLTCGSCSSGGGSSNSSLGTRRKVKVFSSCDSSSTAPSTTTSATANSAPAGHEAARSSGPGAVAGVAAAATPLPAASGSTTVDTDDITRRIAASRARRAAARLSYNCPACSISAATPANIARHMARCCPDLMVSDAGGWAALDSLPGGFLSPQHDAAVALLRSAGGREQELRRRVLACVFWSGPVDSETGLPTRLEAEEAARRLGLPLARASSVLQRAMAAVPLASDTDGAPLDVIFEDEHFLAVNKPVGLHTAPIHRFTGGSVVNKVIAHLNRGRGVWRGGSGGGSPVTLLNPPLLLGTGPDGLPMYGGRAVPDLMPVPEPFTLSSCSSNDGGNSSSDDSGGGGGPGRTAPYQLEPYVLHRLDMNTSGLLLFAKRPEVVAGMHRQFRERTLSKLYLAAAVGCPDTQALDGGRVSASGGGGGLSYFHVDAPIDRHPTQAVARRVAQTGKDAATSFAVLAANPRADLGPAAGGTPGLLFHERCTRGRHQPHNAQRNSHNFTSPSLQHQHEHDGQDAPRGSAASEEEAAAAAAAASLIPRGASLLLCAPHSGRTHQIRVHLHHVAHPIVGDDIYGVTGPWLARQALHAAALRFAHPLTGRAVTLTAPLHDDMAAALASLGLPLPDVAALAEAAMEAEWLRGGGGGSSGMKEQGRHRRPRRP